jgi:hypothetical protein
MIVARSATIHANGLADVGEIRVAGAVVEVNGPSWSVNVFRLAL